jgi:seryl-tRNA synthetase
MLDHRFITEHADQVRENCRRRGVVADVDRFLELERRRKAVQQDLEEANRKANEVSRAISKAKDAAERESRKEEGRGLRARTGDLQAELDRVNEELLAIQKLIPNLSHPDAPVGSEQANRELFLGKTPIRSFDFPPRDHMELAEKLDLVDLEGGARVAGHGFYFLKNEAVLLELALQRYALSVIVPEGFIPTTTPDLARNDILQGVGFIPRGPETQIYSVENSDLSLVATAEITLGGLYSGVVLAGEDLPIKLCGISHCFRTEAGAAGRGSRGIFRVHQFTKVEMFAYTLPGDSDAMHDHLRGLECRVFDGLGIPYRAIDTATGDLGGPAYRKFDLEAWLPGRGEFGEITSTSNCTDYQARRLNTRYRVKGEKGTHLVHTLNGTAVAVTRALVAILENYQQADGTVVVPEVLRPWVGKDRIEPRK